MDEKGVWDFSKLPESEHQTVIDAVTKRDVGPLIKLHDLYRLSEYEYCCGGHIGIFNWFKWAIEQGIIKNG